MNIKRVISLSILLLANVIMLAQPVVRYIQNYNNQAPVVACSTNQKRNCSKHTEQQSCSNTTHEKKGCDTEKCLLRNLFSQENSIKLPKPIFNDFDFTISDILACRITPITDLTGLPFRQKPYIPLFYADFVSQSIGLRAPPVC